MSEHSKRPVEKAGSRFNNDLTGGSVVGQLIKFAIPFLLSNILQACYSVADIMIVGQYCGKAGITGVSIGGQINLLVTNAILGLAVSGTVLVAQYLGAKKYEDQRRTIGTLSTMFLIFSVVVTAVMLVCGGYVLRLLNTPESAFGEAERYLDICMCGTLFMFGYNAICAVLRGMGDSKRPLYFVAIAVAVNVVLDLLLVGKFNMSAAGAALATIISQALAMIISLIYLVKTGFFQGFTLKDFAIDREKSRLLIKIGLPSAVQSIVVSLSFLLLTRLVNSLPNAEVAAACQGIGGKVNSFGILPGLAVAGAVSSMVGQSIGAGLYDRAKKTMTVGIMMGLCVSIIVFAVVELFPEYILMAFIKDDPEVIATGVPYMRLISMDYIFASVVFSLNALAIGSGHTLFALFNALFSSIAVRVPMAYLFVYAFDMGFNGVGLALGIASLASMIVGAVYVQSGRWKRRLISS